MVGRRRNKEREREREFGIEWNAQRIVIRCEKKKKKKKEERKRGKNMESGPGRKFELERSYFNP